MAYLESLFEENKKLNTESKKYFKTIFKCYLITKDWYIKSSFKCNKSCR